MKFLILVLITQKKSTYCIFYYSSLKHTIEWTSVISSANQTGFWYHQWNHDTEKLFCKVKYNSAIISSESHLLPKPHLWIIMSGSSHIQSVLIGVEYRNCRRTLNVYLLFAILLGQIKSKLNYRLVTYKLASP